jgi:hypothetical protein
MAPTTMMYRFMCISDFGVKVYNNAPDRHAFLMIEAFGEGLMARLVGIENFSRRERE